MRIISCPQCHNKSIYDEKNPYRPFCSERCQKIDFGAWANETYIMSEDLNEVSSEGLLGGEDEQD